MRLGESKERHGAISDAAGSSEKRLQGVARGLQRANEYKRVARR